MGAFPNETNFDCKIHCSLRKKDTCPTGETLPADYPGILRELRRIGSNVDQLLVKARAFGFVDEVLLRSIKEQVNRMDAVFGQSFGDWEGRRRTWR